MTKVEATMESLPDEILLKIVKMAAQTPVRQCLISPHVGICGHQRTSDGLHDDRSDVCSNKNDFLIDVIMRVSKRFKKIAESPEFWRGTVQISLLDTALLDALTLDNEPWNIEFSEALRRPQKYELMKHLLHDKKTELFIFGSGKESINIMDLAARCMKLETLLLRGIDMWPNFPSHWTSLSELWLFDMQNSPFEDMQLHLHLPNLRKFYLSANSVHIRLGVPDMTQCAGLEKVWLGPGQYAFTNEPKDNLPRGLKDFCLYGFRFFNLEDDRILSYSETEDMMQDLHDYMDDCRIDWRDGYQDTPDDMGALLV